VTQRSIGAIGLDTPSIDHGPSKAFEAHRILFEAQVPALENLAALDALPPGGFEVIALPMKIRGGSGAPVRVVALLPARSRSQVVAPRGGTHPGLFHLPCRKRPCGHWRPCSRRGETNLVP
jgi:hypothetical protein